MVSIAEDYGYDDAEVADIAARHLASMGPSVAEPITDDEHEILSDAADEVEAWLSEHVAPAGHYFEWSDGEFFLRAEETVEYLLEHAPNGCEAVASLYQWSTNYDPGKGPMTLFLDLIGWSDDELGEPLYSLADASLGYHELSELADALKAYTDAPHDVRSYVDALIEAEAEQ